MLTADRLREVLSYDQATGRFFWLVQLAPRGRVWSLAGCHSDGRVYIRIDGVLHLGHRLAWLYVHGRWPADQIDHINRNGNDNRFSNLREATGSENLSNIAAHRDNATGLKGITFDLARNKWRVQISKNGRKRVMKRFASKSDACEFYLIKCREYHGEYAPSDVLAKIAEVA